MARTSSYDEKEAAQSRFDQVVLHRIKSGKPASRRHRNNGADNEVALRRQRRADDGWLGEDSAAFYEE